MEVEDGSGSRRLDAEPPDELRQLARATRGVTRLPSRRTNRRRASAARLGFVPVSRTLAVDLDVLERDLERKPRGASFGSVHAQTDDLPMVERAVRRFIPQLAGQSKGSVVVPPRSGWVSVYDELCDRDPSALPQARARALGRARLVVVAFGVEEGAVARYLLLERGRLLDEYLSIQEYYGPLPSGEVMALGANPTLVERLTGADRRTIRAAAVHGTSPDELPPPVETVAALAARCGSRAPTTATPQARERRTRS